MTKDFSEFCEKLTTQEFADKLSETRSESRSEGKQIIDEALIETIAVLSAYHEWVTSDPS